MNISSKIIQGIGPTAHIAAMKCLLEVDCTDGGILEISIHPEANGLNWIAMVISQKSAKSES